MAQNELERRGRMKRKTPQVVRGFNWCVHCSMLLSDTNGTDCLCSQDRGRVLRIWGEDFRFPPPSPESSLPPLQEDSYLPPRVLLPTPAGCPRKTTSLPRGDSSFPPLLGAPSSTQLPPTQSFGGDPYFLLLLPPTPTPTPSRSYLQVCKQLKRRPLKCWPASLAGGSAGSNQILQLVL